MTTIKPIRTLKDVKRGLNVLKELDSNLTSLIDQAGEVPLRLRPAGLDSLCEIVVSQQLSVASADAIWSRLTKLVDPFNLNKLAEISDKRIGATGISRPKIKTIRSIAAAMENGLDLEALTTMESTDAHSELCKIWGIGRWSADIYLLFCAGHPDIFPSGDVALQHAVTQGLNLPQRPSVEDLDEIATAWSPWRGVAARLFWSYYRTLKKGKETMPL